MDDRQMERWLSALADDDARVEPPRDLEARVLSAWDARADAANGRRRVRWRFVVSGMAAVSGIAAVLGLFLVPDRAWRPDGRVPAPPAIRPPVQAVASSDARVEPASGPAPARRERPGGRRPTARRPGPLGHPDGHEATAPAEAPAVSADGEAGAAPFAAPVISRQALPGPFIALAPDATFDGLGALQLSRVRVPRGVLVDLGVLRDGSRNGDPVQVDVVFGEDGLARAIRLASGSGRMVR